jgi:hypothetical protein
MPEPAKRIIQLSLTRQEGDRHKDPALKCRAKFESTLRVESDEKALAAGIWGLMFVMPLSALSYRIALKSSGYVAID